jgi:hypothetical protein
MFIYSFIVWRSPGSGAWSAGDLDIEDRMLDDYVLPYQ